jgi:hypothetical protein
MPTSPSTPQDPTSTSSPPPFQPLFTLLTTASQTHHPTVHYLFTNDPTDALTTAALDTLTPSPSPSASTPKERYLIIDLDATGSNVVASRSLSPEWAVTIAEVGKAPTWGEGKGEAGEGEGEGALMLRIEGVEAVRGVEIGKVKEGEVVLDELVERYMRGLEGLRRVVEGAGMRGGGGGEGG